MTADHLLFGRVLIGAGRDVQSIYALQHVDGTTAVYFDRIRCATRTWDVFAVVDP